MFSVLSNNVTTLFIESPPRIFLGLPIIIIIEVGQLISMCFAEYKIFLKNFLKGWILLVLFFF